MNVSIEYCMEWNYQPKAFSLRDSLNAELGVIAEMIPSSGGVFEVNVNGTNLFSKKQLGSFPDDPMYVGPDGGWQYMIKLIKEM